MTEVYKIIHNSYNHESVPNLLKNNEISQRTGNRGHSLKLFTLLLRPKPLESALLCCADYWGILSGKQVLFTPGHAAPDRPVTKILSQYIVLG